MNYILLYSVVPIVVIGLIRKYREYVWGKCVIRNSLQNKIYLITGANSGIGKETAKELAKHEATVIMACRNLKAAEETIKDIKKVTKSGILIPLECDLASFNSIKQFVKNLSQIYPKIDVLINNAGVSIPLKYNEKTVDNFEINFGVNHLGHFLLTNLLIDNLTLTNNSRVVIVASLLAQKGEINFDNLNGEQELKQLRKFSNPAYNNSKLANFLFAYELTQRTKDKNIDVFTLCPGFTYTNIARHYSFKLYELILFLPVALFFLRTAHQGAQTVLFCATEPKLQGQSGKCYKNCQEFIPELDYDKASRLWNISMQMCKQ